MGQYLQLLFPPQTPPLKKFPEPDSKQEAFFLRTRIETVEENVLFLKTVAFLFAIDPEVVDMI